MERLDFCSLTGIIKEFCNEEKLGAQLNFVEKIFHTCVYGEEEDIIFFDETQVCRWLKGQVNVSRSIISYYLNSPNHQLSLKHDIETNIVSILYDKEMAVSNLKGLLLGDTTISESQKEKLLQNFGISSDEQIAAFITDLLLFSMERKFIKRDSDKKLLTTGEYSPAISDYIFENDVPAPCRFFCGRDTELEELHDMLLSKGKMFLYGIAGIGKSELAKAYAKKYKKEYTNILYFTYTGSLTEDIASLDFTDDLPGDSKDERLRKHNRFLRSLKSDSLIIIDNYDTTSDKDSYLSVIMKYKCRILFATRSSFYDFDSYELSEISDVEELISLAGHFYEGKDSDKKTLEEIIKAVHFHTFTVELAARLLHSGMLTPKELLQKLTEENVKLSSTDTIGIKKDGTIWKNSYYGHIHTLFSLSVLDNEQLSIMRYMSLIPLTGIDKRLFARWSCQKDMDIINNLMEQGFIKELPLNRICLHPMIREITIADTVPTITACRNMLKHIQDNVLIMHGIDVPYANILFETIDNIMSSVSMDDIAFYLRFIEDAFAYMDNYRYEPGMLRIVNEMERLLSEPGIGTTSDRALLYDFRSTIKFSCEQNLKEAIRLEEKALSLLPEPSAESALLISNVYSNYGGLLRSRGDMMPAAEYMEKGINILRDYKLEHMNQMIAKIGNYAVLLADIGNTEKALTLLRRCEKTVKEYNTDICHDYAILEEIISRIYLFSGNVKESTSHRKKAIAIYEKIWISQPELIEEKYKEIEKEYIAAGVHLGSLVSKGIEQN